MAKTNSDLSEGFIYGMGNPLLDISARVTDDFIKKYDLPKNAAILAEKKHAKLYDDLINEFEIDYSAGGATQNTLRFVEWVLGTNKLCTTFVGAIGNDYFGKMMEKRAKQEGVKVLYQVEDESATGTCAVMITDNGNSRSLCAYLGAAKKLTKEHIMKNWYWVEKAKVYYFSGHSLSVVPEAALTIAKQTIADKFVTKLLFFNLSAPYVCEQFSKELMSILPYVDYFFANHAETLAFAKMRGYKTTDVKEIAKLISNEPCEKKKRVVILTQEEKPVVVARKGETKVDEYPVIQLKEGELVDTNGAGDAFTGGFLAQFVQEKPFDVCMKCAIYCATECIKRLGCVLPKENTFKA